MIRQGVCFAAGSDHWGRCWRFRNRLPGRWRPRRLWPCRHQRSRDMADQSRVWAGCGKASRTRDAISITRAPSTRARHRRVRYHPAAPIEAWHPRHRNRFPRPPRLRRGLPRGCALPPHRGGPDALRAINRGAVVAPSNSPSRQPPAPTKPIRSSSDTNATVKLAPTPTPGLLATLYQLDE